MIPIRRRPYVAISPDEYETCQLAAAEGVLSENIAALIIEEASDNLRYGNVRSIPPRLKTVVKNRHPFPHDLISAVEAHVVSAFSAAGWALPNCLIYGCVTGAEIIVWVTPPEVSDD